MQRISKTDLGRVELWVLPVMLVVLVVVFGSIVAATMPIAMGIITVSVTLGLLYLVTWIGNGNLQMQQWRSSQFGGGKVGPNPTDRAKPGTKRSLLTEADGGPLAVVVAGANMHDCKLLEATLAAVIVNRPKPQKVEQNLCLDKGYDNPTSRDAVEQYKYTPHIRRIPPLFDLEIGTHRSMV